MTSLPKPPGAILFEAHSIRCAQMAAAGIPRLHPHLMRHTSATQYLVHGGDVISLQRKLGHAGIKMTNLYVHLASDQLVAIQERVSPMDKLDIKAMKVPEDPETK